MGTLIDYTIFVGSYVLLGAFIVFVASRMWPE
jgi:hypothetical protein